MDAEITNSSGSGLGSNGQSRQDRSVQAGASVEESSVITPEEPGDNEEEVKMQSHIETLEEEDSEAVENEPTVSQRGLYLVDRFKVHVYSYFNISISYLNKCLFPIVAKRDR